jgi:hypothetical protein
MSDRALTLILVVTVVAAALGWGIRSAIVYGKTYDSAIEQAIHRAESPLRFWIQIAIYGAGLVFLVGWIGTLLARALAPG